MICFCQQLKQIPKKGVVTRSKRGELDDVGKRIAGVGQHLDIGIIGLDGIDAAPCLQTFPIAALTVTSPGPPLVPDALCCACCKRTRNCLIVDRLPLLGDRHRSGGPSCSCPDGSGRQQRECGLHRISAMRGQEWSVANLPTEHTMRVQLENRSVLAASRSLSPCSWGRSCQPVCLHIE